MPPARLSHIDKAGRAIMVDVGHKPVTSRSATATGEVSMQAATLRAIAGGKLPKGEVLAVARIAGILAAKRCGDLIPLCHGLNVDSIAVDFDLSRPIPRSGRARLAITAIATISAKTGVEMEALTAVAVAALTVYDMCKAIDKTMEIGKIKLIKKTGGISGR